jgi:hypothetical protein
MKSRHTGRTATLLFLIFVGAIVILLVIAGVDKRMAHPTPISVEHSN